MTLNDPIVLWAIGAAAAAGAWIIRTWIVRQDKRITELEAHVNVLNQQMATHAANSELIVHMNRELQDLIKLTSRIAGHLQIS